METKELTACQANALKVFADLGAPTMKEWAAALGTTYNSAVHYRDILVVRGCLTYEPLKARSTRTTATARKFLKGLK